ncbi:MAG: type III secretion system translocon subunit SctE [Verrucomicrobiales bacterium]|nr:type III secretion system translocon subunit SctE [Verrucomicrobiales bacterium]
MDHPTIQARYLGEGKFQVGNEVVPEKGLRQALQNAAGSSGLFTVNGKALSWEVAANTLSFLALASTNSLGRPSLTPPLPGTDKITDVVLILQKMQMESGNTQLETSRTTIEQNRSKNEGLHKEKMEKVQERIEDLEKAAEKEKKAGIWGKIAKAFEILGAAIAAVFGAILVATGVAAGAGAAMITLGILVIANSIADMAVGGNAIGKGLIKAGVDPQVANGLGMAMGIALNIGLAVASGGSSIVISTAAAAKDLAAILVGVVDKAINATNMIISASGSLMTGVGSGVNNIQSANARRDAEMAKAEATDLTKLMKLIQQKSDEETEMIQQLVEQVNDMMSRVMTILSGINDSQSNIVSRLNAMA